jgi:hypothetical protein
MLQMMVSMSGRVAVSTFAGTEAGQTIVALRHSSLALLGRALSRVEVGVDEVRGRVKPA